MKILAIDPGSRVAGYAAIKVLENKVHYLGSGVIEYPKSVEFLDRVPVIFDITKNFFQAFKFDILALESLINVKNVNSLAKLSQARGALISALSFERTLKLFEYSPNMVKSSVTGFGHADKLSVQKSLEILFKEKINFKTDDESDALAIAYCCAVSSNILELKEKGIEV